VSPAGDGSITFSVQHHWVTDAGETLTFAPVDVVTAPVGQGIFGATAPSPLFLTGGTGRFERATGALAAFGAADLTRGQTVFRYSGEVCLKSRG